MPISYVAPIRFAREDQRIYDFFHEVGTGSDRKKIHDFQRLVPERRDTMMAMMKGQAKKTGLSVWDMIRHLTLQCSRYLFRSGNGGSAIRAIPDSTAANRHIFDSFTGISGFSYECDQEWEKIKLFFIRRTKNRGAILMCRVT